MIEARMFRSTEGCAMTFATWDEARSSSIGPGDLLWVDVEKPGDDEGQVLREHFRFHPLAVQDALAPTRRPKVNDFGQYLFMIFTGVRLPSDGDYRPFETVKLAVFMGPGYLVTIRPEQLASIEDAKQAVANNAAVMSHGPAFLLHEMLDRMVDQYLPLMDRLGAEITRLERKVIERPAPEDTREVLRLRRMLDRLQRAALQQRETVHRLQRGEFALVQDEARVYIRDVFDHLVRVADLVESHREHLAAVMEAHLSATSNRMNEIMKVLTVIGTIILPMTFITGVYGMNFRIMPEINWPGGYLFAWGLMLAVGGGMYLFLKRKRWI
jgi:magnesium transporter